MDKTPLLLSNRKRLLGSGHWAEHDDLGTRGNIEHRDQGHGATGCISMIISSVL